MHQHRRRLRCWHTAGVEALLAGLALGLGSGVAPGPLLALAIATTVRRGIRPGLAVSAAPLISDSLIIALSLTLISQLPSVAIAGISIIGALVITWFSWENFRASGTADVAQLRATEKSIGGLPLLQAATINLLNPAPWLFWVTAGAPLLISFFDQSTGWGVIFLVAFYVTLVGSKATLVVGIALGRHRVTNRVYRGILLGVAIMLLVIAIGLVINAINAINAT